MHAVCTDDGIGNGGGAIGEAQANAIARLVQSDQLVVQADAFGRYGARQRLMQIAAMREQIWCAEFLLGALAKDHVELDLAGLPVAIVPVARIERLAAHARLEPKAAQ